MKPRDPFIVSMAVLGLVVLAGLVAIALGWFGMRDHHVAAYQLPYAVSGVAGGVALAGFGLGLMNVQATRRREAQHRAEFERLVVAAAELLGAARGAR